jgi:hypothetical protein
MFDWYQDLILRWAGNLAQLVSRPIRSAWQAIRGLLRPGIGLASTLTQQFDQARAAIVREMSARLPRLVDRVGALTARAFRGVVVRPIELAMRHRIIFGSGWAKRLALSVAALPTVLAAAVAASPEQAVEIVRAPLSQANGAVARVVMAEGVRAAHHVQVATWEQLGEVVVGYQVNAIRDQRTRPAHLARHGTVYYRNPRRGQLGFDQMPHPPLEADGTMAHNCRCFLTPVFDQQAMNRAGISLRA